MRPSCIQVAPKALEEGSEGPPSPSSPARCQLIGDDVGVQIFPSVDTHESSIPEAMSPVRTLRFHAQDRWCRGVEPQFADCTEDMTSMQISEEEVGKYELGELLGEGSFAKIYKVRCKETGRHFALKRVRAKDEMSNADVLAEIGNAIEFDHPYVLKMHGFWQSGAEYSLVMDLCTGGDLRGYAMRHIAKLEKANPHWDSGIERRTAARFSYQMLNGLVFLHHWGFIHRDIKPENYLLEHPGAMSPLKLADFGFTCRIARGQKLTRCVGSPMYAAPEVLTRSYDQKADVWSLGVTCFGLCTNRLPFEGEDAIDYLENVKAGAFVDNEVGWRQQMPRLRSLVNGMLARDPETRPSAKNALAEHAWLRPYGKAQQQEQEGCCSIS